MAKTTCKADECAKPSKARGYCPPHYQKLVKYGDPLAGRTYSASPTDALVKYTERRGDCLVWTGAINKTGYGSMRVGTKTMLAHRFAYEQAHGPIPDGLYIDHRCHNTACVNVDHLRLATQKQNMEHQRAAHRNSASGFRGVYWNAQSGKWVGQVRHHGKSYYLGLFEDVNDANAAVVAKRNELFTHNDVDRMS